MKKLFCDLCGKEVKENDCIEQTIIFHNPLLTMSQGLYCNKCWNKEEKRLKELKKVDITSKNRRVKRFKW